MKYDNFWIRRDSWFNIFWWFRTIPCYFGIHNKVVEVEDGRRVEYCHRCGRDF